MRAERGEACVHLGGEDASGGAGVGVAWPDAGRGVAGGQFLGDGDGFGDDGTLGRAHRGGSAGGVEILEQRGQFVGVEPGGEGADGDAEGVEEEPAAQAPAGIGAVADHEVIGHGVSFCASEAEGGGEGKR